MWDAFQNDLQLTAAGPDRPNQFLFGAGPARTRARWIVANLIDSRGEEPIKYKIELVRKQFSILSARPSLKVLGRGSIVAF
jgi:hypothetical protein